MRRAIRFVAHRAVGSGASLAVVGLALAACFAARPAVDGPPPPDRVTRLEATTHAPAAAAVAATPRKELPRGGRSIFPTHRLVGFCGTPGAPSLGELQGNLSAKAKALETQAAPYGEGRTLLPVFELIAVVVQSGPGPDGKYRYRVDGSVVTEYLRAARRSKALLLLNIQPGQSDFPSEVKHLETYLREPDVGIALDPEWAMKPGQRPGARYGQTTGGTLNEVAGYLSALVEEGDLPEKALVFHQVGRTVVKDESVLRPYPGVALIESVDGLGPMQAKLETYAYLMATLTAGVHPGFKLFFEEDRRGGNKLMTPAQVLALSPQPEYVMYE